MSMADYDLLFICGKCKHEWEDNAGYIRPGQCPKCGTKPADRINRALAGNAKIDKIIDALGVLKDTRIFCARWNNHYRELVEEYALLGMMEGIIGGDHSEAREAIRDELRSTYNYDIVEDKRVLANGELAA